MDDTLLLIIVAFFGGFTLSSLLSDWLHDLEDQKR